MPSTPLSRERILAEGTCRSYDAREDNPYGYLPSIVPGVVFSLLFGFSMAWHAYQAYRTRTPWLWVYAVGALGEVIGWIARAVATGCSYSVPLFQMQLASLIISPNFITAGIYIVLSRLLPLVGTDKSPIRPRTYLYIFIAVDIISLAIQAAGGGKAAIGFSKGTDTSTGTNIMVAGIIFQLVSIIIFELLFCLVVFKSLPQIMASRPLSMLCGATTISVAAILVRSVYRTIELLQGWRGYLITRERYFVALDGTMILVALLVYNVLNPGELLRKADKDKVLDATPERNHEK
ncbi:MAG: hypothetical protein LQ343_004615 [Gyalolechia ehrenbergii]|nr:MAG: hypothetical protein LQ343_004615 [Gyalolechia ehrenbergii]